MASSKIASSVILDIDNLLSTCITVYLSNSIQAYINYYLIHAKITAAAFMFTITVAV